MTDEMTDVRKRAQEYLNALEREQMAHAATKQRLAKVSSELLAVKSRMKEKQLEDPVVFPPCSVTNGGV